MHRRLSLHALLLCSAFAVAPVWASVSVSIPMAELVHNADMGLIGVPRERHSVWEGFEGGKRIVTYTRISVERMLFGEPAKEVWVRTLGGTVEKLGQQVSGEPELFEGKRQLLFLSNVDGALVVTARAQGHYRIEDGERPRLRTSPDPGVLLPPRGKGAVLHARDVLAGADLSEAIQIIQQIRAEKPKPSAR